MKFASVLPSVVAYSRRSAATEFPSRGEDPAPGYSPRVRLRSRVRRLAAKDAGAYAELRHRALETDPRAFASSVEDDLRLSIEYLEETLGDASASAPTVILGLFEPRLVGVLGALESPIPLPGNHSNVPCLPTWIMASALKTSRIHR